MKETEPYTKVHDFLFTDLKLSEMMARIFSFILTKWIGGIPVYRQRYVAEKCRVFLEKIILQLQLLLK